MYNNQASRTMLGYLSSSQLLFPTYTYEVETGFCAQRIQGSYTRNDEQTYTNINKGEVYLLSGNSLRLYFKDVENANLTATKVGYVKCDKIEELVIKAHDENEGDYWNVEVYFYMSKNI